MEKQILILLSKILELLKQLKSSIGSGGSTPDLTNGMFIDALENFGDQWIVEEDGFIQGTVGFIPTIPGGEGVIRIYIDGVGAFAMRLQGQDVTRQQYLSTSFIPVKKGQEIWLDANLTNATQGIVSLLFYTKTT